jgi:membrane glycosyltransferase
VACVRLRGEQAEYGGTFKLAASALLELLVSALLAPVRMLAHTAFVLGPLTGLRLEWQSPPRDANVIAWRDAFARIGLLAAPVMLLVLLALPARELLTPHLAALMLPLTLAVPLAVIGSHPRLGAFLRRLRMLWVPQEHRPPRTLARAIEQLGFRDLVPPPRPLPLVPSLARSSSRWSMALASVMMFTVVGLAPRPAANSEMPAALQTQLDLFAALQALPRFEPRQLLADNAAPSKRPRAALRTRPARMIDDSLRERARDAVRRSLAAEAFDPV